MQHTFKRVMSTLLVLVMVLSIVPVLGHTTATATTENSTTEPEYLVNFDFEDGENPGIDEGKTTGYEAEAYSEVVDVNGNKVLKVTSSKNTTFRWRYDLGADYNSVTVTYNVAAVSALGNSIMMFPTVANEDYSWVPNVEFGFRGTTLKYAATQGNPSVAMGTAADTSSTIAAKRLVWYKVKLVYNYDSTNGTTAQVYINDVLTNVPVGYSAARSARYIIIKFYAAANEMYVDNLRVTVGDVDHEAAAPNASLCTTCTWADGVCSVCQAHCDHDWQAADCDSPKTCETCGKTDGEKLGHNFVDGKCTVCSSSCTHEEWTEDYVCTVCAYKCTHQTWNDATCLAPKTCATCGKTEGAVGDHQVNDGKGQCIHCGADFLAFLEFDEMQGTTNNTYGTAEPKDFGDESVLHVHRTNENNENFAWNWEFGSSYDNVTVSYNVAIESGTMITLPAPNRDVDYSPYTVQLGIRSGYSTFMTKPQGGSWTAVNANGQALPYTTMRWYTVKIVYSKGTDTTVLVYIDDQLTDIQEYEDNKQICQITVQLANQWAASIYVDNVRATVGDHTPAVPTAGLCTTCTWVDGVCSVCQAHCDHDWQAADCDSPKTCTTCGKTDGEKLGHSFVDGKCTACGSSCTHEEWTEDYVCTVCAYKCTHQTWNAATCQTAKTCTTCDATEGNVGDHEVVNNVCTHCQTEFLAFLDFEGENPALGNTNNTDSATYGTATAVPLDGSSVLQIASGLNIADSTFRWYYPVSDSGLSSITVSYNVAAVDGKYLYFPAPSQTSYPYDVQFGVRGGTMNQQTRNLQTGTDAWSSLTVGEEVVPYVKLRWHTVKIVYSRPSKEGCTVKVYLDGQLTNAGVATANSTIKNIAAQIYKGNTGSMYIDNVRATVGDHLPAVPTAPLCSDNSCVVGEDGVCQNCHAVIENYTHTVESVNMALGDTLDMNFYIDPLTDMGIGTTYTAEIVQTLADGSKITKTVPQTKWSYHEGYEQYYVTYGVAAKEMGDQLTVTIRDSQGNAVSYPYTDTVKAYAERVQQTYAYNQYLVTLCDDLLIYGAAAQKGFGYDTENLVSTDAPGTPTVADTSAGNRDYWNGTALVLESNILMKVFYKASAIEEGYSYQVTYTDHYGNSTTLTGTDFGCNGGEDTDLYVPVTGLSIADYQTAVTVKILDANGQVLDTHTVTDSMESFVTRSGLTYDIYKAIIQVGGSAHKYFHTSLTTSGYEDEAEWNW